MTRIKDYAITHPLSSGYVAAINRRVIFDEQTHYNRDGAPEVVPVGAEVTLTFSANPHVLRYKEARKLARAIGGNVKQV